MRFKVQLLALAALCIGPFVYAAGSSDITQPLTDPSVIANLGNGLMTAGLDPIGDHPGATGDVVQKTWYDDRNAYASFDLHVAVPIPSEEMGIYAIDDAMAADVRVRISQHGGQIECMLVVDPVMAQKRIALVAVDLAAQSVDGHVHHVAHGVEGIVPTVFDQLGARYDFVRAGENGLVKQSSAPLSRPLTRSSTPWRPVSNSTGVGLPA